ncbi:hypothetical protein MCHI_001434 [Candidatus Magnetoovum chiemensis]|nr:hypothetical protein MCHI_001434 [Candidatus Magnetoovum chiemensis]
MYPARSNRQVPTDSRLIHPIPSFLNHKPPLLNHQKPISNFQSKRQHLLRNNNRQIPQIANLLKRTSNVLDDRRLNPLSRLIEQQHLGIRRQRPGNRQLLLLPPRQIPTLARTHVIQHRKQRIQILRHPAPGRRRQPSLNILQHTHAGKNHPPLRHIGNPPLHPLMGFKRRHIMPIHTHLPLPLRQNTHQALEQRGLAHPVAPHHRDDLTLRHIQLQVVKNLALPVPTRQFVDLEHARLLSGPNTLQ